MSKKAALLASMAAMLAMDTNYPITNPYSDLPDLTYTGGSGRSIRKTKLSSKQKKSRSKNKAAKQSRKRNRK